ncbi:MAG TPA: C4-dicarboxylate ABC transporter permease [Rhodocyclaceae bacterium]|nr:MAG: C4-dicarboxylate ABC transporter permease [Betaproteobacteria bacterium CG2_30_68_42]PIV72685.1 MAG: C4-dicarboxylate ABC transporter permease [Rhodocyclales bacterium CG17_big_fil_post_rev_8_21_14_2_50_68_7]PIX74115.1 MAG: C4-dicarboxylate ABC transporter permease [Rhodocyclales bacterium CG_4_10_14_3_um_filter_68_10]PJA58093.1 MAG: C4-dicarboxylate ABC transporter permease [Rhodocyclales bacterium CG_4_9_14_3_um_filter_68_10]HCX34592.1 C4-dicarboxylate ABC transporter permease [Rhodoc
MSERGGSIPPRIPVKVEEFAAAAALAAIVLITFANVVVRYFTDESFAFTEEFSVFLLVVLTFVGASAAVVRDSHIRVSWFVERTGAGAAFVAELAVMAVSFTLFAAVAGFGVRLVADDVRFETTSPGIGVPQWLYSVWLPLLAAAVALRILGRIVRLWRARARC